MSIFVTSTSYYHIGLLTEEGLCRTCVILLMLGGPSRLMMLGHFASHDSAYLMIILTEMMALNLRCLIVQRVGFGTTDSCTVRLLEVIAASSVKRVRLWSIN